MGRGLARRHHPRVHLSVSALTVSAAARPGPQHHQSIAQRARLFRPNRPDNVAVALVRRPAANLISTPGVVWAIPHRTSRPLAAYHPVADGAATMNDSKTFVLGSCPKCHGKGVFRDPKHFFYGICLIAGGMLCFFEWPPTPGLFAAIWDAADSIGLPSWVGSTVIWTLTGVPPLFGLAFMYSWMSQDTCPECRGHRKVTGEAPKTA